MKISKINTNFEVLFGGSNPFDDLILSSNEI
jgi:hypothetical protein